MGKTKPFAIPKALVWKAYQQVRANQGSAGVDKQSIKGFEQNLRKNLYKIWNRMSSGTYFPQAVKAVPIPKKQGGFRILGVPTVGDRICQTVVKLVFEPMVEPFFLPDSYGYRPNKSALDAIGATRQRCWQYDWLLEFDIRGLFDNIDHKLLMKAVRQHTDNKWVILYIERWLVAPMQMLDGTIKARTCGVPQGGVISVVLANIFLHYVFDVWMTRNHQHKPWSRYADDAVCHCKTEVEAQELLVGLTQRFIECKLELHPDKTKIVYCGTTEAEYPNTDFTFLGYNFRKRSCKNKKYGQIFIGFTPAVCDKAIQSMKDKIKESKINVRTMMSIKEVAYLFKPVLQGWINYYGKFTRERMYKVLNYFNLTIVNYLARKYKFHKRNKYKAINLLIKIRKKQPDLFTHWKCGMVGAFII